MASTTLAFVDAVGNPLPAACRVSVAVSTAPTVSVLSGYLAVGGTIVYATPTNGSSYIATFTGTLAPAGPVTFTYTGLATTTVAVPLYISTDPSATGYANLQSQMWPNGWFSDSARQAGGNAYNLAYALGWLLNQLDQQWQQVNLSERLQSSAGQSVDSWVADFFGATLPRNAGETDSSYVQRAITNLAAKKGLRPGIIAVGSFYGACFVNEPWLVSETGGYDTAVSTCGYETAGGWGDQNPMIQVFITPPSALGVAAQGQMKAAIVAARGVGINIQVIYITPSTYNGAIL